MSDPFARIERAYAEALLLHADGVLPETPAERGRVRSTAERVLRAATIGLVIGAVATGVTGAAALSVPLLLALYALSTVTILATAVPSLRRRTGLPPAGVGELAGRALVLVLLTLGFLVLPPLLPVLGIVLSVRLLYRARARILATADRAARELELARIRGGAEPRIYGLVDERHGGDPRRLAVHGDAVARIRSKR